MLRWRNIGLGWAGVACQAIDRERKIRFSARPDLSRRGRFIATARRIKGRKEELLHELTAPTMVLAKARIESALNDSGRDEE